MANLKQLRRRIRSVQNTAKITKAMQMIAASKMRRAQQLTLAGRPYAEKLTEVLSDLAAQPVEMDEIHPLLKRREINRVEIIHITPDRGLCGGLPSNVNRVAGKFILDQKDQVTAVAVGRKGRDFLVRSGLNLRAVFTDLGDRPSLLDVLPVARLVMDDYINGEVDQVMITYTEFVNTVVQRPIIQQLLPLEAARMDSGQAVGYVYEPHSVEVLSSLLPRFVEMEIYHSVLESVASEQSARMVAMRNATESANDMIDALTLTMNKVRQEAITRDLLDIVGGVAALE
ncbi:MAG: ATP synthase F1 subunit gamma [SAR202 cluster bacterium Io17-Chloro-G3]|nr:MAG: ATP synthase F1 subunit gamma [SAR202 cluster bacterium Io17-Chloro-G3]